MSKVSSTHWELANAARWFSRKLAPAHGIVRDDIKVSGRVERYHRADGYRDIQVIAPSLPLVTEIGDRLAEQAKGILRGVTVHLDLGQSIARQGEYILSLSIWSGKPGMRQAEVIVSGEGA